MLPVTELGVAVFDVSDNEIRLETSEFLCNERLLGCVEFLLGFDSPIVTFNGPRFDWPALGSIEAVERLLPRTIDLYSALYPCVSEIVDAEGVSAFPKNGEYGVLHPSRLAEVNLGFVPGAAKDARGEAELAGRLWHHLVSFERAVIAGRTHALDAQSLRQLRGERASFSDPESWHQMLAERPEPQPYRRRDRNQITFPRVDQRYV